ncbi:MAG: HAD-IIA family hydrolase [Campylobacterales bacterium]|nr:HAD-IIA family hydrolase [Campylobacterales bacterium]
MPKAYFIDIQGTLIDDVENRPIAGAIEFINYLNSQAIPYLLITNNTQIPSKEFFEYLKALGFAIEFDSYIDTFTVLQEIAPFKEVAIFGTETFEANLKALGYEIVTDNPEAIIITLNKNYTNEDYAQMIDYALQGAKVIGMHGTSIYAKEGKSYPGVGAILAMLHYATKAPTQVVGKPSQNFYQKGLSMLQAIDATLNFEDIEIISDDVVGDLVGAKALGMQTSFVLSGKYQSADIVNQLAANEKPDAIYANMAEILKRLW